MREWRSGLALGDWVAVGGGLVLAFSLLVMPWFALSVDGFVQPDSEGDALELLDGLDVVLILAALVPLVAPALRVGSLNRDRGDWAPRLVAAAGAVATLVALYVILSPPEPDAVLAAALESTADLGLEPRAGAFVGLLGAFAILAGGALTLAAGADAAPRAAPPAPAPTPAPQPARAAEPRFPRPPIGARLSALVRPLAVRRQKAEPLPQPDAPAPSAPAPEPAPPKPKSRPKRKPPKPKPAPDREPAGDGLLSLATASAEDLVGVGFSSTQAQRIVRYRDEEAIVTSVADLKRVPGIAKPVLERLVESLRD